jgi:hypothetical protein
VCKPRSGAPRWLALVPAVLGIVFAGPAPAAQQRTLYTFNPYMFGISPGSNPAGPLLRDASGALYGATSLGGAYYNGAVFKLSPRLPGSRSGRLRFFIHSQAGATAAARIPIW